jgi:hypothetical protein
MPFIGHIAEWRLDLPKYLSCGSYRWFLARSGDRVYARATSGSMPHPENRPQD